ncbi:MAG TPA: hypothetical protein VF530_13035 [Planctomycetota bacterium]
MRAGERGTRARSTAVLRRVWCAAGGRLLVGRLRPVPAPRGGFLSTSLGLPLHGGTVFEFEAVALGAAQAALAAHLAAPGVFAIESAEGARLDLGPARGGSGVAVAISFLDPVDAPRSLLLAPGTASALLATLYELTCDAELAQHLGRLAHDAAA